MRKLVLVALLVMPSCSSTPRDAPRRLKDPACREYVAVPGEPCRGHRYLWTLREAPAVCLCETVPP